MSGVVQTLRSFSWAFFPGYEYEKSVCACEPWLLHVRPQNHGRVWVEKEPKAYLMLISVHLLLWSGTPCTRLGCSKHTLLRHVQFVVHQHPQALLLWAALHPFSTQAASVCGVALTQVQHLSLGLVDLHKVHMDQHLQPDQVSLNERWGT